MNCLNKFFILYDLSAIKNARTAPWRPLFKGNHMKKKALFLAFVTAVVHLSISFASAKVICNQFDVITEVTGRQVAFRLSTDLPDETTVMSSVSRLYWQEGSSEAYFCSYYSQRTTIRELKQLIIVNIDDMKFKNELKKKQKMFALSGEPFWVTRISDDVELYLTVPINQDNPAFGKGNKNLEGPFVSKEGLRTIRVEKRFNIPFDEENGAEILGERQYNLDPYSLEVNLLYRISKKTPISNEIEPKDPLKAIAEIKYLPPKSVFRILKKKKVSRGLMPYYYVRADVGGDKRHKMTGWIYSPALIAQDLSVVE